MATRPPKFKWADGATWVGTLLALITANWALLLSAALAVGATMFGAVFRFATDAHVQITIEAFIIVFWTYIGIRLLHYFGKVSTVKTLPEIRYAINVESFGAAVDKNKEDAWFQLIVNFRNVLNFPINLKVQSFRLTIGDRICKELDDMGSIVIPRIGVRGIRSGLFAKEALKEKNEGFLDLVLLYGDPDEEVFSRKFSIKMKIHIALLQNPMDADNPVFQMSDEFISSEDAPL